MSNESKKKISALFQNAMEATSGWGVGGLKLTPNAIYSYIHIYI